jgi:hypothetical protein
MTKNMKILKKLSSLSLRAFVAGLLVTGGYSVAFAVNSQNGVSPKERTVTYQGSFKFDGHDRGAKTFEVKDTSTGALLVDEAGVAITSGWVTGVDLSTCATGTYLILADTAASTGFSESTSGRMFVPPLTSTPTATTQYKWSEYPLQFGRGLGIKWTAAGCFAYVHYIKNGGKD